MANGDVEYRMGFEETSLFSPKLTAEVGKGGSDAEMTPVIVRVHAVASSGLLLPDGCAEPMLQCRVVRSGRRRTAWPWFVTGGCKKGMWMECGEFVMPFHAARRR